MGHSSLVVTPWFLAQVSDPRAASWLGSPPPRAPPGTLRMPGECLGDERILCGTHRACSCSGGVLLPPPSHLLCAGGSSQEKQRSPLSPGARWARGCPEASGVAFTTPPEWTSGQKAEVAACTGPLCSEGHLGQPSHLGNAHLGFRSTHMIARRHPGCWGQGVTEPFPQSALSPGSCLPHPQALGDDADPHVGSPRAHALPPQT